MKRNNGELITVGLGYPDSNDDGLLDQEHAHVGRDEAVGRRTLNTLIESLGLTRSEFGGYLAGKRSQHKRGDALDAIPEQDADFRSSFYTPDELKEEHAANITTEDAVNTQTATVAA